ncbi:MAG: hypothetical protein JJT75_10950 [Opitutales bacterium]|nr:hypothetical protein [Opitutales bacterium]MCH8539787.1 hypothetical protein [Opitutales bacterium]
MTYERLKELLERYISSLPAKEMAKAIHEDMNLIGFQIKESHTNAIGFWKQNGRIPQAERNTEQAHSGYFND